MRVSIVTLGTIGDVLPLCALGVGLTNAGHRVRIATHLKYRSLVVEHGLEYAPMALDPESLLSGSKGNNWLASRNNPLRFLNGLVRVGRPAINQLTMDAYAASKDADAVIYTPLGMVGFHVGEKLQIPTFFASLWPITPTRNFPSVIAPAGFNLGKQFNRVSHLAAEQAFWQPWRRTFNNMRAETLDLPPLPFSGICPQMRRQQMPHLYGFSDFVVPKPEDWPDWAHITGYWFPSEASVWKVPQNLEKFLEAGDPPVCVGFSSLKVPNPAAVTKTVVESLRRIKKRGVLLTGWGALQSGQHGDDMYVAETIPHDYLFKRVEVVVHPGGAGTSAACLRAGVPSVVIPSFADQFFWANRLFDLGVTPPPIRWKDFNSECLGNWIENAVSNIDIRKSINIAQKQVCNEDGIASAVQNIEETITAA